MKKIVLLLAVGIGYVLGTKAGRERYEQLRAGFLKVKESPTVQSTAHQAADVAREKAPVVKDKIVEVAGAAAEKVRPSSGSSLGDLESQLPEDNVARQENPYPQGDLP